MQLTWAKPALARESATVNTLAAECGEAQWLAACTLPRHEKRVGESLKNRGIEAYLPTYLSERRWNGRRALVSLPLFPGYVFVKIVTRQKMRVLENPSVLRFVSFNGRPAVIEPSEIEQLRSALSHHAAQPFAHLCAGKRVRLKTGPLAGLEGKIVRRRGKSRFVVTVEAIQQSIVFDLEGADLQLIGQTAA
jgi:transcription antitermination factor NusG